MVRNLYDRIAFIGGPPRVGKSSIAKRIIDISYGTQIISTDSIRDALKKSRGNREGNLFIFDDLVGMNNENFTRLYESDEILKRFILQSEAMWPSVRAFCDLNLWPSRRERRG